VEEIENIFEDYHRINFYDESLKQFSLLTRFAADFPTTFESIGGMILDFMGLVKDDVVPDMSSWRKKCLHVLCRTSKPPRRYHKTMIT
jgi:hypothetical protein